MRKDLICKAFLKQYSNEIIIFYDNFFYLFEINKLNNEQSLITVTKKRIIYITFYSDMGRIYTMIYMRKLQVSMIFLNLILISPWTFQFKFAH